MVRKGFTLLEVTLATTIALLLMYGLYTAIDVQLNYADAGRDRVEHSTLARALFNTISNDVTPSIGFPDPGRFKDAAEAAAEEEAATDSGTDTGTDTGTETDPATTEEAEIAPLAGDSPENALTVKGNATELVVFVSRVPRDAFVEQENENGEGSAAQEINSDQRRITYWLAEQGSEVVGLARREERLTANTSENNPIDLQPDTGEDIDFVISREVVSLAFRYWDTNLRQWVDTWDGATLSSDGVTPIGAPSAIEVMLEVKLPQRKPSEATRTRKYRHVIYIPTSDGVAPVTEGEPAP